MTDERPAILPMPANGRCPNCGYGYLRYVQGDIWQCKVCHQLIDDGSGQTRRIPRKEKGHVSEVQA